MNPARTPSARHRHTRRWTALWLALAILFAPALAAAQVAQLDLSGTIFHEPSASSKMTVLTPAARLSVSPWEFLSLHAGYEADIVSGASERVKAGPLTNVDVVSSATELTDLRNVYSGGFTITRENTELGATYSYGAEKDYRSQAITVAASTDFFQRNTQLAMSYARGFDEVCDMAQNLPTIDPTVRQALDSSDGCFSAQRQTRDVNLDNFQAGWTQTWTPVFATQLVLTGALQNGFLGNPYRAVVIGPNGDEAQEHHPENRARGAVALRFKYYLRPIKTAFGLGVRAYRDTWDVLSQTYELEAERYVFPWLRINVHGRFYNQSGALFWSNDYTGGEPKFGPRGQYWTGDRELSPLQNYTLGGRLLANWRGRPGERLAGVFLGLSTSAGVDLMKTNLEEFTWGTVDPDDTFALIGTLSLGGEF